MPGPGPTIITSPPGTSGWRRVDLATIAMVLYIGPMQPSQWDDHGPEVMADYVISVVNNPYMPVEFPSVTLLTPR